VKIMTPDKNIYLIEGEDVGEFGAGFVHMTKNKAAKMCQEHPEWNIKFWMKALTNRREAQFGNWLTRIRNFLMTPPNMIRTISERIVEIATPTVEQAIQTMNLESEQVAQDFIDSFGLSSAMGDAEEMQLHMIQNRQMTAKTAQTVDMGYIQNVNMSGQEATDTENMDTVEQESLADDNKFQDALNNDSVKLAELISEAITRAGMQALSEQGIDLPSNVAIFAKNQVFSTLNGSMGRFLSKTFHDAISSVLGQKLGTAYEYVTQGSELSPKTNAVSTMLNDIFSAQVPAPQSNNGIVANFINNSVPVAGAFMGIAVGSMIKSLGGTENSQESTTASGKGWYNRYVEANEKELYVAYLVQKGQPAEIIEDSYVQAYSPKQARQLVLRRGGPVAKRIRRYESYDEYGIVVYWGKAPKRQEKQDKKEDIENNVKNEVGESLSQPQQMNFFTELGV